MVRGPAGGLHVSREHDDGLRHVSAGGRVGLDGAPARGLRSGLRDDVDWGVAEVEEVHLSKRGDFDVGLGGYYRCEAKAALGFGGEVEEPARDPGER